MNMTIERDLIGKAIVDLNKELINPKNTATNPFFKSKYAPLNDILSDIRPLMAKHGLAIIQSTSSSGERIGIETMILHESGQYIKSDLMYIKSVKDTAQDQGSAITYGRRYQISAMLSIASEDDDDGNNATKPKVDVTPPALKNQKGEIEIPKGDAAKAMAKLELAKSEDDIQAFLKKRALSTWTPAEAAAQDAVVAGLRIKLKAASVKEDGQ